MMKAKDLIKHLQESYDPEMIIAYCIWRSEDVIIAAEHEGKRKPSKAKIARILEYLDGHYPLDDAWKVIEQQL